MEIDEKKLVNCIKEAIKEETETRNECIRGKRHQDADFYDGVIIGLQETLYIISHFSQFDENGKARI